MLKKLSKRKTFLYVFQSTMITVLKLLPMREFFSQRTAAAVEQQFQLPFVAVALIAGLRLSVGGWDDRASGEPDFKSFSPKRWAVVNEVRIAKKSAKEDLLSDPRFELDEQQRQKLLLRRTPLALARSSSTQTNQKRIRVGQGMVSGTILAWAFY